MILLIKYCKACSLTPQAKNLGSFVSYSNFPFGELQDRNIMLTFVGTNAQKNYIALY